MRDLLSLLVTIVMGIIFIQLLPTLIWLFLLFVAFVFIYVTYQRYKARNYTQDQPEYTNTYTTSSNSVKEEDVIDVEYSEREEDIS